MANNRMWLRCRGCGTKFLLGKSYGSGYNPYYTDMTTCISEYYEEHNDCGNVEPENQFELVYEHSYSDNVKEESTQDTHFTRPFNYGGE